MTNWYTDSVCIPVQERLDKISLLCQQNAEVQVLINEINLILESAGTEIPEGSKDKGL